MWASVPVLLDVLACGTAAVNAGTAHLLSQCPGGERRQASGLSCGNVPITARGPVGASGLDSVPEPADDPALVFRSIEEKFVPAAWIVTDIKQEQMALAKAFERLDSGKVHFLEMRATTFALLTR